MTVYLSPPWAENIHTAYVKILIQAKSTPRQYIWWYPRFWKDGFEPPAFQWYRSTTLELYWKTYSKVYENLSPGTLYNFQFKFEFGSISELSSIGQFHTLPIQVETAYAQNITDTTARLYGKIWSDSLIYVNHWVTVTNPITGWSKDFKLSTTIKVEGGWKLTNVNASGLTSNTRYLYRSRATPVLGGPTVYGEWRSFRTGIYKVLFRAFAVGPDQKHYYGEWKSFDRPF